MSNQEERPSITCRQAGRRGGLKTSERHGPEHYKRMGQLSGKRVKELIERGRELEKEEQIP